MPRKDSAWASMFSPKPINPVDGDWLSGWLDQFVPQVWRDGEPELARKARGLIIVTVVAGALCVLGGLRYALEGEYARAAFLELKLFPVLASIWIMHRTLRTDLATHWLCGLRPLIHS